VKHFDEEKRQNKTKQSEQEKFIVGRLLRGAYAPLEVVASGS
jgi:hypothetical protein